MPFFKDCTGSSVVVYDDHNEMKLTQTKVVRFDKNTFTITIDGAGLDWLGEDRVSVLIMGSGSVYEFKGNMRRKTGTGLREISLFKGRPKENRSSTRYTVNAPARVEHLIIAGKSIPMRSPLDVTVINVSVEGALVKAKLDAFNIGTSFELKLKIGDANTLVRACVMRRFYIDDQYAGYGCRFL